MQRKHQSGKAQNQPEQHTNQPMVVVWKRCVGIMVHIICHQSIGGEQAGRNQKVSIGCAIKGAGKSCDHKQKYRAGTIEGSGIEDALDGIRGGDCHHAGDGENGAVQDSPKQKILEMDGQQGDWRKDRMIESQLNGQGQHLANQQRRQQEGKPCKVAGEKQAVTRYRHPVVEIHRKTGVQIVEQHGCQHDRHDKAQHTEGKGGDARVQAVWCDDAHIDLGGRGVIGQHGSQQQGNQIHSHRNEVLFDYGAVQLKKLVIEQSAGWTGTRIRR